MLSLCSPTWALSLCSPAEMLSQCSLLWMLFLCSPTWMLSLCSPAEMLSQCSLVWVLYISVFSDMSFCFGVLRLTCYLGLLSCACINYPSVLCSTYLDVFWCNMRRRRRWRFATHRFSHVNVFYILATGILRSSTNSTNTIKQH